MNPVKLWLLSLAIFAAVVGVVVVLLQRIIEAAQSIDRHAADIWVAGKQIAGNTVSIWMLEKTNEQVSRLVDAALSLERTVAALDERLRMLASTPGGGS